MFDDKGRVWFTSKIRPNDNPAYCKEGSSLPSAKLFPLNTSGRQLSVYRLPETEWSRRATLEHTVSFPGGPDLPVYVRVTQADGNQAWTSPIYLIE